MKTNLNEVNANALLDITLALLSDPFFGLGIKYSI